MQLQLTENSCYMAPKKFTYGILKKMTNFKKIM